MEQGTQEWLDCRIGKLTASKLNDALAMTKTGESATRINHRLELVAERFTQTKTAYFTNSAMQWGIDNEPLARAAYESYYIENVELIAFVDHSEIAMTGASPDGLIGKDGLIEIKCPNTTTHLTYINENVVPERYKKQMTWQIVCTGRKWCDFVSFDPRLPSKLQLFVIRYEPTEEEKEQLTQQVIAFLASVDELQNRIEELRA